LYGGTGKRAHVAYVGITDSLKRRAAQHLLTCDSSVVTGTSAVGINPDYVTEIRWWEHSRFSKRAAREAAEMVAFDVLDPALRSRKPIGKAAKELCKNSRFRKEMEMLFNGNRQPAFRHFFLCHNRKVGESKGTFSRLSEEQVEKHPLRRERQVLRKVSTSNSGIEQLLKYRRR
jgi:hypothetical protein